MTNEIADRKSECPVCGGFMPYDGKHCVACAMHKFAAEESRKEAARAKAFGSKWRFHGYGN